MIDMVKILKEGKVGRAEIQHFTVDKLRAMMFNFHCHYGREMIQPGKYVKLLIDGEIFMSNTPCETWTSEPIITHSKGDVLMAGLGIGYVAISIKNKVNSLTVLEIEPDVISVIKSNLKGINDPKIKIIQADAKSWQAAKGQKFDAIWIDIWPSVNEDNRDEIKAMKKHYRKFLKKGGWMGVWGMTSNGRFI